MISFPNCKINIGLSVTEKRADGFHNIESVFYPVNWCDILEINKSDGFEFYQTGINIGSGSNLCVKAYHQIKETYNLPNIKMHLHKIIPIGAGLGGGSSDAAFTIKMLNELFKMNLSEAQMKEHAAVIGSDCAFFIENKPLLASGKGEILREIEFDLKNFDIVIVFPDIFVSTPEAFSGIKAAKKEKSFEELLKLRVNNWKNIIINDFEENIFNKYPPIKTIKEKLYESGAIYASMSGSGSAVYGIFNKNSVKEGKIKNHFPEKNYKVFWTDLNKSINRNN